MKSSAPIRIAAPLFVCIYLLVSAPVLSQSIDWNADTVSFSTANTAQSKFISDLKNAGRKPTTYVTFDVNKLKDILDNCAAKGVTSIQFMIVYIRTEDTARYASQHPGLSNNDRKDLIGRQTLVIKAPRSAFFSEMQNQKSGAMISKNNPLMISLLAAGLIEIGQPYGGLHFASGDIYFSTGTICPPPASCN